MRPIQLPRHLYYRKCPASFVYPSSKKSNVKESLQKLVYPEGLVYDKLIDEFRTAKVNSIFFAIEDWNGDSDEKKRNKKVIKLISPFQRGLLSSNQIPSSQLLG